MTVTLRPAIATDAEVAARMLHEFHCETSWLTSENALSELVEYCALMISRDWMMVAEISGQISGFLAIENGYLHGLYVFAKARGQRVGQTLLRHVQMQEMSLDLWTAQANLKAQKFYQREGFVEVERSAGLHNDEGLPDIRFQWHRERIG